MKKYVLITALTASMAAHAQDLSTEVVVDRTVSPVENIATRPATLTPVIILPQSSAPELSPQIYTGLSAITRVFDSFTPLGGSMCATPTPYRGYLSAAYGPLLSTDIRAGYRFVQSQVLTAGAALSFASESYHAFQPGDYDRNRYGDGKVRGYLSWSPDSLSALNVAIDGRFLSTGTAYRPGTPAQNGKLDVSWKSQASRIAYGAAARVELDRILRSNQTAYDASAFGAYVFRPGMLLGLDINGRGMVTDGSDKLYAVTATPFFSFAGRNIYTRVGVGFEESGEDGSRHTSAINKFHITPQFELRARMSSYSGIWMCVSSGTIMNSRNQLRDYSIFVQPKTIENENSYLNVMAEGGLTFGPASGFSIDIFGGYASAKNWNMIAFNSFIQSDIKGWHIGANLKYTSRLIDAHACIDAAPRSGDSKNYWVGNPDAATLKIDAAVDVTPIDRLTIGATYKYTGGRDIIFGHWDGLITDFPDGEKISDLGLRAQYRLNDAISFQGTLRNILNQKNYIFYNVPAQGINGLVGVTYKF
ncbi:MAG: hypothetical protein K2M61_04975 [Muribaculaceae bacterium]|nr:hypothetical protein [Muribaculaceae bacterium]